MIKTVYSEEEANKLAKEGYDLIAVNTLTEFDRFDGSPLPFDQYIAYTLTCAFIAGLRKAGKGHHESS